MSGILDLGDAKDKSRRRRRRRRRVDRVVADADGRWRRGSRARGMIVLPVAIPKFSITLQTLNLSTACSY